jgi:two-component system phosphate regulon sensor histidine kinase PhoR
LKKNSPIYLAIINALLVSLVPVLASGVLLFYMESRLIFYICISFLTFIIAFIAFYYSYKKYLSDQIKLLYRLIQKNPNEHLGDSTQLEEAYKDIRDWSEGSEKSNIKKEELHKYRKEFLGNVSHELRTPLFVIQGYIDILINGGLNDPKININYLHKCMNAVERMTGLVENLEGISSLETGDLILNTETFDLIEEIKKSFESLEIKAAAKDINIHFSKNTPNKALVIADKNRIRQVLDNIILNSIKYGKEDGRVDIDISLLNDRWVIEISDDGIGIKKEDLPRVFERFYRTEKSRSRNDGGAGLGLSISKHILEAHNEKINISSKDEKGTIVSFGLKKD